MKITLFASSLQCGGAERVLVMLAQGFLDRGYTVNVVTLAGKERDFYTLPVGVTRVALDVMGNSSNLFEAASKNLTRLTRLRQAVTQINPDLIISFIARENISLLLALWGTKYPVFVTEHNDQRFRALPQPWSMIRRLVYPKAATVVSVSEGVNQYFSWLPEQQKAVIYNPFIIPDSLTEAINLPVGIDSNKKWLISMGRLIEQKGFDYLLTAYAQISDRFPDWQLLILGDGELRQQLSEQKENLQLGDRVIFTGRIKNPFALMNQAELFVMASRFEGFPMAHGEALASGLPVIATDCPSGPSEIIRDGIDGILIPSQNVDALAQAMADLMADKKQRQALASKATEVTQRFSITKVIDDWESLFANHLAMP